MSTGPRSASRQFPFCAAKGEPKLTLDQRFNLAKKLRDESAEAAFEMQEILADDCSLMQIEFKP